MDKDLKEVLAAIERTKGMKDRIHKELGIKKVTAVASPEDMYEFEYKKPDLEHRSYMIVHGKCAEKAQEELKSWGYEFLQTRHFPKSDKQYCRIHCKHCGVALDEKEEKKYLAERKIRLEKAHKDWLEEKALREEWEAEQVLLGKL